MKNICILEILSFISHPMAERKPKKESNRVAMVISVPREFREKVRKLAAKEDRTVSSFIRIKLETVL